MGGLGLVHIYLGYMPLDLDLFNNIYIMIVTVVSGLPMYYLEE